MVESRIAKQDWQSCLGGVALSPCVQVETFTSRANNLDGAFEYRVKLDGIRKEVDALTKSCPAWQGLNHLGTRRAQQLACDVLRNQIREVK